MYVLFGEIQITEVNQIVHDLSGKEKIAEITLFRNRQSLLPNTVHSLVNAYELCGSKSLTFFGRFKLVPQLYR